MEFNEKIKNAREGLGWSQKEVADKIGVSLRMYQYYEEGKKAPKYATVALLENVLRIVDDLPNPENPTQPFHQQRLNKKNQDKPFLVPLVPVKAQAGYVKAVDQARFIDTMEEYALPPGVSPIGAVWRYWEVEGDSMEPVFHSGDFILTSQVHRFDWENLRNFYLYVIVTEEKVIFKRVFAKNALEWVLISENEDNYPQQLLPIEYIKEVWVFRRHIVNHAPPTKQFEIKV